MSKEKHDLPSKGNNTEGQDSDKKKNIQVAGYSNPTTRTGQNVRSTSISAFTTKRQSPSYITDFQKAKKALKKLGAATRKMIAEESGLPINCICQYVKMMIEQEFAIETFQDKCKSTGVKAWYLTLQEVPEENS